MEDLFVEDLAKVINDYIKENYSFDHVDIMGEEMVYYLEDGKEVYINIDLDKEED